MKFIQKINRNYLMLMPVLLLLATAGGYFALQSVIVMETRESLQDKYELIITHIREKGELPALPPLIEVSEQDSSVEATAGFSRIYLHNMAENEDEPFIEYVNSTRVNGRTYLIRLRQSLLETEDLLLILAGILFGLLLLAFAASFLINRRLTRSVWAGFENNLQRIEAFSFRQSGRLELINTGIDEFDRLKQVIESLTLKLQSDYQSLKAFTENASHEIQTPLSVIQLNLEELLQREPDKATFEKALAAINAARRLSTLNQHLILLTKIGNHQFPAIHETDLGDVIAAKLQELEPLISEKRLSLKVDKTGYFGVMLHIFLAETLISNLLSNAIRHNVMNGSIAIDISADSLSICNTGPDNTLSNETIFNRFTRGNLNSFGLGLSIVKNICETNQLKISYSKNLLHCFTLTRVTHV